jgi:hypothetical protein
MSCATMMAVDISAEFFEKLFIAFSNDEMIMKCFHEHDGDNGRDNLIKFMVGKQKKFVDERKKIEIKFEIFIKT